MAPMRLSISLIAVLITLCERRAQGFVAPVPVGRRPNAGIAASAGTKSLADGFQARPQQPRAYDTSRWQTSMSAAPGHTPSGISGEESARPASRLSRISGRVRKMIRKAIMGYVPEEEVSYKQRAAQQAAAAAKLRGEPEVKDSPPQSVGVPAPHCSLQNARPDQTLPRSRRVLSLPKSYLRGCANAQHEIADERLRGASMAAKAAAIETVEKSVLAEDDEDDFLLNSNFVQLDIGNQSPMEAEDKLASLRKRLEQGLPPDTAQEQAEKRRQAMEQQFRLQKQNERSSKPPSFDGDTAVAERPSSALGAHQQRADEGASRPKAPRETPKLAAAEDVERLNRMFGSMGGEPLR